MQILWARVLEAMAGVGADVVMPSREDGIACDESTDIEVGPAGEVSYPKDIVGTASFLASDDSDYMTGQMIHIDGGWCIQ